MNQPFDAKNIEENIDKTADLIIKKGFPEWNADRLYLMSI